MSISRFKIACVLTALLLGCCAQAQTSVPQKEVTEVVVSGQKNSSDWFRAESQHFIVYSDSKQEHVSLLLHRLERFDHLLRLYTKTEHKTGPKLTFYYQSRVNDLDRINKNQPAYAIGLYTSCPLGVQGFGTHMYYGTNTLPLEKQPENEGLSYIFEAYARHFLYRYTDLRTPTWYIDGFAQYFANTRFSDTQTVVGMPPKSVKDYLNFLTSGNAYSLDYKDILLENNSKGRNVGGIAGLQLEFQAKSWVLTHYILSSSENIQHFRTYIRLTSQGTEPTAAFEQAFGYKVSKLSNQLSKYRRLSAEALKLNLTTGATEEIRFSSLPASANTLLLADAALKSCPGAEQGASLLKAIRAEAKKYPDSDYAQLILSRAQIEWGNPQDALPYLTRAAQGNNTEAFYLLGSAHLRLAEQNQGDTQKNHFAIAQENLLKVRALNPQSAEAFYAFFKAGVQSRNIPTEEVLQSAVEAMKLAPEISSYTRAAALSYAYANRIPETEYALNLLAQNSRDPRAAKWAKDWQLRLSKGVTRSTLLAEMRLELRTVFNEWTVSSDEVMQAVKLASGLENARDFIQSQQLMDQQTTQGALPGTR